MPIYVAILLMTFQVFDRRSIHEPCSAEPSIKFRRLPSFAELDKIQRPLASTGTYSREVQRLLLDPGSRRRIAHRRGEDSHCASYSRGMAPLRRKGRNSLSEQDSSKANA